MTADPAQQAAVPARQAAEVDWDAGADGPQASALPPVWPSARALLRHLPAQPGGLILDPACGAGSPTFEAARLHPEARVLGIDRAARLIGAARRLAADHAIGNAGFEVMSVDALALPDNNADAAISHLAFLQEGDVAASARELARVLKDGARQRANAHDGRSPEHGRPGGPAAR